MMNYKNQSVRAVQLLLLDSHIEIKVIQRLASSEVNIIGRHLALHDIEVQSRRDSILITASDFITADSARRIASEFYGVIVIGNEQFPGCSALVESELDLLPKVIAEITAHEVEVLPVRANSIFYGIVPRAGVTTIQELFTVHSGGSSHFLPLQLSAQSPKILCSEIDDSSVVRLFTYLEEVVENPEKIAIVFNKVGSGRTTQLRIKAIAKELQALGFSQVFTLPFDEKVSTLGKASRKTSRRAEPLFDWILKAN